MTLLWFALHSSHQPEISRMDDDNTEPYELFTENDNRLQGRISLKTDGGVADIDIVETAPHNYGHNELGGKKSFSVWKLEQMRENDPKGYENIIGLVNNKNAYQTSEKNPYILRGTDGKCGQFRKIN